MNGSTTNSNPFCLQIAYKKVRKKLGIKKVLLVPGSYDENNSLIVKNLSENISVLRYK